MAKKRKKKYSNVEATTDSPQLKDYKKGAIIGGIVGAMAGLLSGKRIILYTLLGAIAGGYVAHSINDEKSSAFSLKNYKKTKFKDIRNGKI